jgi:hypothetical protein
LVGQNRAAFPTSSDALPIKTTEKNDVAIRPFSKTKRDPDERSLFFATTTAGWISLLMSGSSGGVKNFDRTK